MAFAIGGAGIISFGIIAALDSAGLLIHQAIDQSSQVYRDLVNSGVKPESIVYSDTPICPESANRVSHGWEVGAGSQRVLYCEPHERTCSGRAVHRNTAGGFDVRSDGHHAGTLQDRRMILLTTMARVFGPLPGGLAVSDCCCGRVSCGSTGIVGATVVTMGLLALPTMLRNGYSPEIATGVIAASGTLGQIIPPSIVIVLLGTLAGDLVFRSARGARDLGGLYRCADLSGRAGGCVCRDLVPSGLVAGHPAGAALCALCLWLRVAEP